MIRPGVVVVLLCAVASADAPKLDVIAVPEVPKLVTSTPSRAVIDQGRALNVAALTLHRANKLDAAVAKYIEALKVDPSNTITRYNLASAFVSKGDPKRGLAVLAQLRVASCAFCMQRLRDAQSDKEWQALWADATFKAIVAMAAAPANTASGPAAPVVNVQVEVADDQRGMVPDHPLAPDHVRVHIWNELEPGFYSLPPLVVVLRNAAGVAMPVPAAPTGVHRVVEMVLPGPGWWSVDVEQAGAIISRTPLLAPETRCLGGAHTLAPTVSLTTRLRSFAEAMGQSVVDDTSATLDIVHNGVDTGDGATFVEWRRSGKVIVEQNLALDRDLVADEPNVLDRATRVADLDAVCPLTVQHESFQVPDEVRAKPGDWEVRLYERDAQAYAARFSWKSGSFNASTVTLATIPSKTVAYEKPFDPTKAALAAELRAMLRSKDAVAARLALNAARLAKKDTTAAAALVVSLAKAHGALFADAEMPVSVAARPLPAKPSRFTATAARLPSISPDGKVIAFRQDLEFSMFPGQCSPPAGHMVEFYPAAAGTDALAPGASQDLATFEPLTCKGDTLPGGYKVVHPDEDLMHIQLHDPKGAVVADLTGEGNGTQTCFSAKHRVVVLMVHEGVGGDCDVVGSYYPLAAKY